MIEGHGGRVLGRRWKGERDGRNWHNPILIKMDLYKKVKYKITVKMRASNVLPSRTDYFTSSFLLNFLNFHHVFLNTMFSISWLLKRKQGWIKLKWNICLCHGTLG